MKYWEKALKKLENSDLTFNAIYNTAFSFSDNVFYEIIKKFIHCFKIRKWRKLDYIILGNFNVRTYSCINKYQI